MLTLMSNSKGRDNKKALIYAPGDPRAEAKGATACSGIVRPSQGTNTSDALTRHYACVHLDLGHVCVPAAVEGGGVRTIHRRRIAVGDLGATRKRWKDKGRESWGA
eukprot:2118025-Pyramimonas_sp.AAC.1